MISDGPPVAARGLEVVVVVFAALDRLEQREGGLDLGMARAVAEHLHDFAAVGARLGRVFGHHALGLRKELIRLRVLGGIATGFDDAVELTSGNDVKAAAELLADEKERAEHLQLLDLGRNDCGRVARTGSVRVTEQFTVERYSHVMHIVSNVEGKLKEDLNALAVLRATFPAGTVSGAPKVRAMEVIDDIEPTKRGPYAGAILLIGLMGSIPIG